MGFWQAHAPRQPLVAHRREGSLTADLFALAVNALCHSLSGPTVLVLANASIHKAHVVRACEAGGAASGLTRFFLPAYSPELNHIELLGHRCKPYWICPQDYATEQTLPQRLEHVLANVGSRYTITFA